ncbi:YoaK family protein [Bradyrhizobium sp. Bra78]|uniref:YoaK family protein n=1 Tax=Bradyrhizobium sp. Bra78 TaxID=2926010 RepID=UPI0021C8B98C|nr:YoaK family protein [Bradyrhizobium sp. Bra78]
MSTMDIAPVSSIGRDETVPIALLLAFAGGYLDAYTWIVHGVMANAQTANLVLLWVYGSIGDWTKALHFVPPILAFAAGIVIAAWLRRATGERARVISTLVEIVLLVVIAVLHNRLPDLAGTLGISFVAAIQSAVFTRVEGVVFSSVMITGNMRQAIEGAFAAASGDGSLRPPGIFATLCLTFGLGAALGAFATKQIPNLALGSPVIALLGVLLLCEAPRDEASL